MEQTAFEVTPLIVHPKNGCTECWNCVRVCPVKAIRIINGVSEVVQEKCVACGLCASTCPSDVIKLPEQEQKILNCTAIGDRQ